MGGLTVPSATVMPASGLSGSSTWWPYSSRSADSAHRRFLSLSKLNHRGGLSPPCATVLETASSSGWLKMAPLLLTM